MHEQYLDPKSRYPSLPHAESVLRHTFVRSDQIDSLEPRGLLMVGGGVMLVSDLNCKQRAFEFNA